MAFLSPLLLAGVALIGIPIALHLRRRRDPVRVEFPALRLLKRNRHRTETHLRLRRWLLLTLRCLLLAALAIALARPLLRPPSASDSASSGPVGEGVALALVIDNGPNAAYQSRNRSRLEQTQSLVGKLLEGLPADTPIVLADRSPGGAAAEVDPSGAESRISRLAISPAAKPLADTLRDTLTRLAEMPASRREAYVFTDLSEGAWNAEAQQLVAAKLDQHPEVHLRLVDIGVAEPRNAAIADLQTTSESLPLGQPLAIRAQVHRVGLWRDPLPVQLWVQTPDGPVKRDERMLDPGSSDLVDFRIAGLPEGFSAGFVRVVASDGAPDDDVRHFAVEVRRARSLLIVAPRVEDAIFFFAAVDPPVTEPGAPRRFETKVITYDAWPRQSLAAFDSVVLLDPPPAVERGRGWRRLYDLAVGGGGVGFFLGREATLEAFNTPDAQAVLPAELLWRSREPTYLRPTSFSHPIVQPLARYAEAIIWQAYPVFQRWELSELREGATAVARYADGGTAIVEQAVGRGRVSVMTTSVSDRLDREDSWNRLPTGEDPWPFVLLAGSFADYLTGAANARLNYLAGETITTPAPAELDSPGYVLRMPSGEVVRQTIPPGQKDLLIPMATEPGAYQVQAGADFDRQFAVNLDGSASRLERVDTRDLINRLGKQRVSILKGPDQLARAIDLGRVGRELYGWVLAIAALALVGEQWISSRYYQQTNEVAG